MTSSLSSRDLETLLQISQLFTSQDIIAILYRVLNVIVEAVQATDGSFILYEDGEIIASYITNINEEANFPESVISQIVSDELADWVVKNQQIIVIDDTRRDSRWIGSPDDIHYALSVLILPLIYQGQLLAIITLIHKQVGYFNRHHQQLLTIMTNQIAVAIHNARALKQVQTSQHQLEIILQTIPDILFVLDYMGYVRILNAPAVRLVNAMDHMQVIGIHFDRLIQHEPILAQAQMFIHKTQRPPHTHAHSFTFEAWSEKQKKDFSVTVSMWQDEGQADFGYVIMMHDISQLRDLNRFKDEILHLASHDLRSPLALIAGYADMISIDTPNTSSPVHEHVEVIQRTANRMNTLLEELIRVEQIRSSPLELHKNIDVEKLVRVVLVNGRLAADRKGLSLDSSFDFRKPPIIFADPVLIRQAMENLVNNAVKYTPQGGKITLVANDLDGRFNFVVEDTGIGISQESLPYVFETFYRIDPVQTESAQGVGLGLSLVHDVIERHGGQVWVESIVDQGSRFGFWLPLKTHQE